MAGPETAHPVIETIIAAAVGLLALLGFRLREKKIIDDELNILHKRINTHESSLHDFREEVAKTYPSRVTLREEISALEKNIKSELRASAADLRLTVREEIDRLKNG